MTGQSKKSLRYMLMMLAVLKKSYNNIVKIENKINTLKKEKNS